MKEGCLRHGGCHHQALNKHWQERGEGDLEGEGRGTWPLPDTPNKHLLLVGEPTISLNILYRTPVKRKTIKGKGRDEEPVLLVKYWSSMVSNHVLFGGTHEHWPDRRRWVKEDTLQRWFYLDY